MLLYTKVAPPKAPKTRSRGGCTHCKEKKKKCDETRPVCGRCAERSVECTYDAVKPRQRKKRGPNLSTTNPLHGRYPSEFTGIPRSISHDSDDSADESFTREDWTHQQGYEPHHAYQPDDTAIISPLDTNFETASIASLANFPTPDYPALSPVTSVLYDWFQEGDVDDDETCEQAEMALVSQNPMGGSTIPARRTFCPDLAMIAPCPVASPLLDFHLPSFSEFSDRPNRPALVGHFCNVLSHLIVFREESGNPFQHLILPLAKRSSPVTNAIYALASAHLEYRGVVTKEKSVYFHNQAIQGLAKQIEHSGPVDRSEVLAAIILLIYYEVLVQRGNANIVNGHLKGALTIMSTNPEPSSPADVFLERAFRFYDVITALSNGTAPISTAPATGCLLPVSPLGTQEASSRSSVDTLLGMATTLWPIIHRLSSMLSMKKELEAAIDSKAPTPKLAVLRGEFESTAAAIEAALRQWKPTMPQDDVTDETRGVTGLNAAASDLDTTESSDQAAASFDTQDRRTQSTLHNALAYRHSAFVYLYRTVHSWPRGHPLVQKHTHEALTHCVDTVTHGGPMGALLWPLFVAACEAVSPSDRELAEKAFGAVEQRQGMTNIERAWEIVREVWRRADMESMEETATDALLVSSQPGDTKSRRRVNSPTRGYDRKVSGDGLWRRVSADMGLHIVFG